VSFPGIPTEGKSMSKIILGIMNADAVLTDHRRDCLSESSAVKRLSHRIGNPFFGIRIARAWILGFS
jgi:hypothetical protein